MPVCKGGYMSILDIPIDRLDLVDGDGKVMARFNPSVLPDDPRITGAVERLLR